MRELSFDSAGGGNSAVLRQDTHPALQPLSEMHIMSSCFSAHPSIPPIPCGASLFAGVVQGNLTHKETAKTNVPACLR